MRARVGLGIVEPGNRKAGRAALTSQLFQGPLSYVLGMPPNHKAVMIVRHWKDCTISPKSIGLNN